MHLRSLGGGGCACGGSSPRRTCIPYPTLFLVIGVALLCGGLGRSWARLLSVAGAFYALFGVLRLGVRIDLALLAGAIALALTDPVDAA